MENHPSFSSPSSLQNLCLCRIICSLEHFSPQLLSCIPPTLRYQIFLRSPVVDICHFENTIAFDGIDREALWGELYQNHWKQWNQWKSEEVITPKNMQYLPAGISNREKYCILITTMIFCAERPSGYINDLNFGHYNRCESVPEQAAKWYPTDIVNYLVAYYNEDFEKMDKSSGHIENMWPVPQCELDNSVDDERLSHNLYGLLAANGQCVPSRYSFLMKAVPRLSDADAVLLMMDKCNYIPERISLSYSENIHWGMGDDKLQELLSRFFCRVKEVHVNSLTECISNDEVCSDIVLTTCFASPTVSSLSLHLLCGINSLNFSSEICKLSLTRFHISSTDDFTDTVIKELAEVLQHHSNLCELKIGDTDMGEFPYSSELLSAISTIIRNPRFSKFSFEGCEISSPAMDPLLFTFFSTISPHPQELSFKTNTISTSDYVKFQSPMSLAGCDSALLNKTLKIYYCSTKFCSSLLSLKPLSLHDICLTFTIHSMQDVHDVIESVADNDRFQVNNLALINARSTFVEVQSSLPETALASILKRSTLKSLELDFEWKACDLNSLTNALRVQIPLGSLEKLRITFDKLETPQDYCDLKLLIDSVFNLPQISIFSFDFDIHLSDFSVIELFHQYWQNKQPKEFNFGHFVKMEVSERDQSLIDEMQLVVKEYDTLSSYSCCKCANYLKLCTSNM